MTTKLVNSRAIIIFGKRIEEQEKSKTDLSKRIVQRKMETNSLN